MTIEQSDLDYAEACMLAKSRTEVSNCLDLVQTRRRLSEALRSRRRYMIRVRILVLVAVVLGFIYEAL